MPAEITLTINEDNVKAIHDDQQSINSIFNEIQTKSFEQMKINVIGHV